MTGVMILLSMPPKSSVAMPLGGYAHDVRKKLDKGDVVVFFCAQERKEQWRYYYIGLGTVGEAVEHRDTFGRNPVTNLIGNSANLLIDSNGVHRESLITCHTDWADRLAARYIIFDKDPERTHFNVTNPLFVASL